jgi:hypothetical protein
MQVVNPTILHRIANPPQLSVEDTEDLFYPELLESNWSNPSEINSGFPATIQGCIVKSHVDKEFALLFEEARLCDVPSVAAHNLWRVFSYCNQPCNVVRTKSGTAISQLVRGNTYDLSANRAHLAVVHYLQGSERNDILIDCLPPYLRSTALGLIPTIVQACISRSILRHAQPEPGTWGRGLSSSERAFADMHWIVRR